VGGRGLGEKQRKEKNWGWRGGVYSIVAPVQPHRFLGKKKKTKREEEKEERKYLETKNQGMGCGSEETG